ncbi:DUF4293 domain-containing protein [Pontibacter silvestris]|uniref:DUF4293 domain-containing protein n=1 Tax=Pontibacter silvestris TaxID=2305183 RepID=A0ABW4WWH5_9BACT|nr:DUF4293 domain-containing protein [Pontibacter silvestris]MCC9136641.1 DUF4293 domain-containing protein [Pontibacter silvestris]
MIQRIQTVFLFLLAIAMICMLFLSLWSKTDATTGETVVLTAWNLKSHFLNEQGEPTGAGNVPQTGTIAIGLLAIAAAVVAVYEIFQYKSRLNQMKLGMLNSLLIGACFVAEFYYARVVGVDLVQGTDNGSFHAGFYMPVLALVLNSLANRYIKRDEALVRSVDRLR